MKLFKSLFYLLFGLVCLSLSYDWFTNPEGVTESNIKLFAVLFLIEGLHYLTKSVYLYLVKEKI